MKGFFIDKGTEVGVYRGGFDKNWIVKDRHSFFRHTTRKDLFIDLSDCNVVDDGHGQPVLLANAKEVISDEKSIKNIIISRFFVIQKKWKM